MIFFKFRGIFNDADQRILVFSVNKLHKFIKMYKVSLSHELKKNMVYKISCRDCDATYAGQTCRKLKMQSHTILLVQPGVRPETRTYSDYESINECMEGVCKIYEEHLKRRNPNTPTITYDISQLFDFVDQLTDLSCLVYQKSTNTYAPYNKDWIKEKIYVLLRRAAGHGE